MGELNERGAMAEDAVSVVLREVLPREFQRLVKTWEETNTLWFEELDDFPSHVETLPETRSYYNDIVKRDFVVFKVGDGRGGPRGSAYVMKRTSAEHVKRIHEAANDAAER